MADLTNADMEVSLRMAGTRTVVLVPLREPFTVGRSHRADYQLEDLSVSTVHLEIKCGVTQGFVVITDRSLNGAGVIPPGGGLSDAIEMVKDAPTPVKLNSGILIPMRLPRSDRAREEKEILWLDEAPRDRAPLRGGERQPAPSLPLKKHLERPTTWPKVWATLHEGAQQVWVDEGIEDAMDLRGFYTSESEMREQLGAKGIPAEACDPAVACWKNAEIGRAHV